MPGRTRSVDSPLKARTSAKQHIQDAALALFVDRGYDAVSVEDVARTAEVSPRTVYRYFGTKEQLVVWDPIDDRIVAHLGDLLGEHEDVESFLGAVLAGYADLARRTLSPADAERMAVRMRLVRDVPDLRGGQLQQMDRLAQALVDLLLGSPAAADHPPTNLRLAAYQLTWALLALSDEWALDDFRRPFHDVLDDSLPLIITSVGRTLTH